METIHSPVTTDYVLSLAARGIAYQTVPGYFVVGEVPERAWSIHVSVVEGDYARVISQVGVFLEAQGGAFMMAQSAGELGMINSGRYLNASIGKGISVFIADPVQAAAVAGQLVTMTRDINGPAVSGGFHLGGAVYVTAEKLGGVSGVSFILPADVVWPFGQLRAYHEPVPPPRKFHKKYIPFETLKDDPKGKVIKAIRRKHLLDFKWVILKGGTRYMCMDSGGRDMIDRLQWQVQIAKKLKDVVRIPEIYEYFEENGVGWLAMEYIKGQPLSKVIREQHYKAVWHSMQVRERLTLLDYYLQVLEMVDQLHQQGLVHRDLTTMNVMVAEKGLCLIDMELVYSLKEQFPQPAFGMGSSGYMSPQQFMGAQPSIEEDIYALGAILQKILTGVDPFRIVYEQLAKREAVVTFFTGDRAIARLVAECLDLEPVNRPSLKVVRSAVQAFRQRVAAGENQSLPEAESRELRLQRTINGSIQFLAHGYQDSTGAWITRNRNERNLGPNETGTFYVYGGLYYGVAGPVYTLARARQLGFNVDSCLPSISRSWQVIAEHYLNKYETVNPALGEGLAGIANTMIVSAAAALLPQEWRLDDALPVCFYNISAGVDLLDGAAGQGLAGLQACEARPDLMPVVRELVDLIVKQQTAGRWNHIARWEGDHAGSFPGLLGGNAGVLYFLLQYWDRIQDTAIWPVIVLGLENIYRDTTKRLAEAPLPLAFGVAGIALCLMEAYRLTKDEQYKAQAKQLLNLLPARTLFNDFTLDEGVVGVGEVYVEAYRIFGEDEWLARAQFIADVLTTVSVTVGNGNICWVTDTARGSTADLLVGNSGILHFLLRVLSPASFGFPGLTTR